MQDADALAARRNPLPRPCSSREVGNERLASTPPGFRLDEIRGDAGEAAVAVGQAGVSLVDGAEASPHEIALAIAVEVGNERPASTPPGFRLDEIRGDT